MNRFNPYLIVSSLLLTTAAVAQPAREVRQKELKATVSSISQLATEIGTEVARAMKGIDFEAIGRDAEKLAALSEVQAQKIAYEIEGMDFTPIVRQSEALALEIAQSISETDWQQALEDANVTNHFSFQKEKVIEKTYPVNANQKVSIDNQYGKITVHNWNRNEVKVAVTVRTSESSERRAQEALDRVRINESKSTSSIAFKTEIASGDSNWWSSLTSGGGNRSLSIDYEVYMPKGNELSLVNRYGAIELGDRDGKVEISVSYGSLRAGRLSNRANSLSVAYSKANIEYLNEGDVSVRYGGFTLSEAEKLNLALSYTSDSEIGKVNREADISLRYSGGFQMGLGSAIKKANVAASYSSVDIRPVSDASFNFDVAVSYGGFDYDRNRINIDNKSENSTSKSYTGYWNKTGTNAVNVSSRYGTVSLK